MYAGVPRMLPACVGVPLPPASLPSLRRVRMTLASGRNCVRFSSAMPPSARTLASPQSMSWTSPNCPTITLPGFMSRWRIPRLSA